MIIGRFAHNKYLRRDVYIRDRGICSTCGKFVPFDEMDLDHVIPYALGGLTIDDNLRVSHRSCNRKKAYQIGQESKKLRRSGIQVQHERITTVLIPLSQAEYIQVACNADALGQTISEYIRHIIFGKEDTMTRIGDWRIPDLPERDMEPDEDDDREDDDLPEYDEDDDRAFWWSK